MHHFIDRYNGRNKTRFNQLSAHALGLLQRAPWPGNVRELENLITHVLVSAGSDDDANLQISAKLEDELERGMASEASIILRVLEAHRWNRQAAATELQMSRTTLWRKMVRYDLVSR